MSSHIYTQKIWFILLTGFQILIPLHIYCHHLFGSLLINTLKEVSWNFTITTKISISILLLIPLYTWIRECSEYIFLKATGSKNTCIWNALTDISELPCKMVAVSFHLTMHSSACFPTWSKCNITNFFVYS